jgi:hypothetical protein
MDAKEKRRIITEMLDKLKADMLRLLRICPRTGTRRSLADI